MTDYNLTPKNLLILGLTLLLTACASPKPKDCTFLCPPGVAIPDDCYCLEDKVHGEIQTEAEKLKRGR